MLLNVITQSGLDFTSGTSIFVVVWSIHPV